MPLIDWANDNEGYIDFVGHISAIRQRRQLLADNAIQNRLLSEQIEIHREALSIQKQVQLEQQTIATWQDVLFELGEALKLIESHFKVDAHQAYAEWLELDQTVTDLGLHHRLFRDLQWKALCNATLSQVQYIRDNLDSFILPSQRRTFERHLQKRQKALEAEQERLRAEAGREAAEHQRVLDDQHAEEIRSLLLCVGAISILIGLWFVRRWLLWVLVITSIVGIGFFGGRFLSRHIKRRRAARLALSITVSKDGLYYDSHLTPWADIWSVSSIESAVVIKIKKINHETKSVGMSQYLRIETTPTLDAKALVKRITATQKRYLRQSNLKGYCFRK